jgi:acyl-CoA synthetase (AMP-forming)/AMP-acid ligase II
MLPNCPQTVISYWACLKIGAVVVMTNPLYMEKELVHHFNDSEAKTLITLNLLWKRIHGLKDKLNLRRIFVTSIADCLRFPLNILYSIKSKREYKLTPIPYDGKTVLPWKGCWLRGHRARASRRPRQGSGRAAVHRRHHRRIKGRHADPRQPGLQRPAGQGRAAHDQ